MAVKKLILFLVFMLPANSIDQYFNTIQIGRLRYFSGGDWYSNPSSLPNLLKFYSGLVKSRVAKREFIVSFRDSSYKRVPIIYFTGHGKFSLSSTEKNNLRWYLKNGGFLFADDNFGMDHYIRKELNNLFTDTKLKEIPFTHKIFKTPFKLSTGIPKIHKHYGGPAKAFGLFYEGRMVAFYGYNSDLGDGWEDLDVHNDEPAKHEQALRMGANVIHYALHSGL